MKINCCGCGETLVKVFLQTGLGSLTVESYKKGSETKATAIKSYMCLNCGHIELIGENLSIFQK